MRPAAKIASARSMYCMGFVYECGEGSVKVKELLEVSIGFGSCWLWMESQQAIAAPMLTMRCRLLIVSLLTRPSGNP